MSGWGPTPARYPGSLTDTGPMRECSRCDLPKPSGGGIDLAPGKWCCSSCWKSRQALRKAAAGARR